MSLLDLFLPSSCAICQRVGAPVCAECLAGIPRRPRKVERVISGWAAVDYKESAITLINTFKEHGRTSLAPAICALADEIHIPEDSVLIAMPSRPKSLRARGFVPAEVLACQLARRRGLRAVSMLRFARSVEDQANLSRLERDENMRGAMLAVGKTENPIWLIDDVVTTGASLREAARAVAETGSPLGGFLAIAETLGKSDV